METEETILRSSGTVKSGKPRDMQKLWDQWDLAQKDKSPSDYAWGWNLVGMVLFIAGAFFYTLGAGWGKISLGPLLLIAGAALLAVRKIRSLWMERSIKN